MVSEWERERERERKGQVETAREGRKGQKSGWEKLGGQKGRLLFTFLLPLLLISEPYRKAF